MNSDSQSVLKKNIRKMVRFLYLPKIQVLISRCRDSIQTLLKKTIRFTGGMIGEANLQDHDKSGVVLFETTVVDDGHKHTSAQINGSVKATPNSIVQRDENGQIHGSGNRYGNTGFKLANGIDVSTLFRSVDAAPFTAGTSASGSHNTASAINPFDPLRQWNTGNYPVVDNISLSINKGLNVTLLYHRSGFCMHFKHPDVAADGC